MAIEHGLAVVHTIGVLSAARRRGEVVATQAGTGICTRLGYQAVTNVRYLMPAPPRL